MSSTLFQPETRQRPLLALVACLVLVFAAAAVGGIGSRSAPTFYAQLALPAWAPPAGWFGPVWTLLYALMAVAVWLVWRSPRRHPAALALFATQLVVNALWSWAFFHWRSGEWALVNIVALDLLVIATIASFWRVRRLAAALLLPYLGWILFATMLCLQAWRLNPGTL